MSLPGRVSQEAVSFIAAKAASSKNYRGINGATVFKTSRFMTGLGAFSTAAATVFSVLALLNVPPHIVGWICFAALFGLLGIPLFVSGLVSRVYVDTEGVTIRNLLGSKKRMRWEELEYACDISMGGYIRLCGSGKSIVIGSFFNGFNHLKELIERYRPGVFSTEAVTGRDAAAGAAAFKRTKVLLGLGIGGIAVGAAFLALPDSLFKPLAGSSLLAHLAIALMFAIPGALTVQCYLVSRMYLSAQGVVFRNMFGVCREITWGNLESARIYVKSNNNGTYRYLMLFGKDKTSLRVSTNFDGYMSIRNAVQEHLGKKIPQSRA